MILLLALGGDLSYIVMHLANKAGEEQVKTVMADHAEAPAMVKLGFEQKLIAELLCEHQKMIVTMAAEKKAHKQLNKRIKQQESIIIGL